MLLLNLKKFKNKVQNQLQKLLQNNIETLVFISDKKKMDYVMERENSVMQMVEFMMVIGIMELWMVMVNFFIQMKNLPMKDNGKITHFMEKVQYTMKNQFHLTNLLILLTLTIFLSTGQNMKENLKMILKKDKDLFI